ncbi:TonB-dependent receptor domain-containing protein [Aliikangiella sp. IMCC44359]|uniref:TonB-dependent receptor domain-containing protein n=1 Tax=Aliikangiella sp. IMCC44359 TaxID=3459125 RepID=UPI00403AC3D2
MCFFKCLSSIGKSLSIIFYILIASVTCGIPYVQSFEDDAFEEGESVVVVTSLRHQKDNALINDFISNEEVARQPSSVAELLEVEQGLAINGQPGLLQTVSIRGLARQRVHAYVNGMRITSERRAGIAASFIDPVLLAGVEVTQGPASTYYGSGAIGGGIHLVTRQDDALWMKASVGGDGNEWLTAAGTGGDHYSAGFAFRQRQNGETSQGSEKNNQFSQHSLFYQRHFEWQNYKLDWQFIESQGDDIGKDNSRYPQNRITSYPEEKHVLTQLTLTSDQDWVTKLYLHQQSLLTQDVRPEVRINLVETDSLDIGASLENQWQQSGFNGLFGIDYFARRDVDSQEKETHLDTLLVTHTQPLLSGKENEIAAFFTANKAFDGWSIHSGLRVNYQSQNSQNSSQISDNFTTYFLTVNKPVTQHIDLTLSYGTGFRFASLSERLFTGTTGRGQTVGNINLKPEESTSFDLGLRFQKDDFKASINRFKTTIDHFIERSSIDDNTRTYQNLLKGELVGWQYEFNYNANKQLGFELSGQGIHGQDQQGRALADVPAKRHQLSIDYLQGDWSARLSYVHRLKKNTVVDGELPLDTAEIVRFKLGYQFNQNWVLQMSMNNLLDEVYYASSDDLSTLAAGREWTLSLSYH